MKKIGKQFILPLFSPSLALLMYLGLASPVKDLLRAWKVLGRHYLKSGNSLDETHREETGVAIRTVTVRVCLPFAIGTVVLISLDLAGYHVNSSTA